MNVQATMSGYVRNAGDTSPRKCYCRHRTNKAEAEAEAEPRNVIMMMMIHATFQQEKEKKILQHVTDLPCSAGGPSAFAKLLRGQGSLRRSPTLRSGNRWGGVFSDN